MASLGLTHKAAIAIVAAGSQFGMAVTALAQTTPAPEPGGTAAQGQRPQPGQPGTMPGPMMGQGMMGQGATGQGMPGQGMPGQGTAGQGMPGQGMMGRMMPGMMGGMRGAGMHGHMMKIIFAIADVNGDGGLSLEEITTIHRRIFERVDVNKDGKVTPEEVQAFMRESP